MKNKQFSRKEFLTTSVMGGVSAAAMLGVPMLSSCSSNTTKTKPIREAVVPELLDRTPDGRPLKAALIGCGGRGTGAACDFINAGSGMSVTVLADVFSDKLDECRSTLQGMGQTIDDANCFVGFDAYEKAIASDVDVVLLCTPPHFRPKHFAAAVDAGKHIFTEKPCAVDPAGARATLLASKEAQRKGLCVISGTVRRVQKDVIETYKQVCDGAIGDIVSAHIIRNSSALWSRKRQKDWSDMEYALRNWVNFTWLSGDLIVEQFIHEVDLMTMFVGKTPVSAMGYGGRHRRASGDQYDHFSVSYKYDNGITTNCMSRQIDGCTGEYLTMIYGTNGYTDCYGTIWNLDGTVKWKFELPEGSDALGSAYVQEHILLTTAIRQGKVVNDIDDHVKSTLVAIMGRVSAYSGQSVTWDEIMSSPLCYDLESYDMKGALSLARVPAVQGVASNEQ